MPTTFKFDDIVVATLTVDQGGKALAVTGAFVNRRTGITHGLTAPCHGPWSKDTLRALLVLMQSVQQDLKLAHIEDADTPANDAAAVDVKLPGPDSKTFQGTLDELMLNGDPHGSR